MTSDHCSFCDGLRTYAAMANDPSSPAGMLVADLPASVAVLSVDQYYRGYTVVIGKHHAHELFELPNDISDQFVRDMRRVARAIYHAFGARKMNYELLGNTVAHVHWHVVPRYEWDENPKRPIWEHNHRPVLLDSDAYAEIAATIRNHLDE